jgi:hypothetical protein
MVAVAACSMTRPTRDALVALKKLNPNDPLKRAPKLEDIRYLLTLKEDR